jgi:hypothetical protein
MSNLYQTLLGEIAYAKKCEQPQRPLHEVHGKIKMARKLEALTKEEYLNLNQKCVAEGINNPKYFDKD